MSSLVTRSCSTASEVCRRLVQNLSDMLRPDDGYELSYDDIAKIEELGGYLGQYQVPKRTVAMKPLELYNDLIPTCTNEGDVVLDFCTFRGRCGESALGLNRRFVGIEIVPDNFKKAKKLLETREQVRVCPWNSRRRRNNHGCLRPLTGGEFRRGRLAGGGLTVSCRQPHSTGAHTRSLQRVDPLYTFFPTSPQVVHMAVDSDDE